MRKEARPGLLLRGLHDRERTGSRSLYIVSCVLTEGGSATYGSLAKRPRPHPLPLLLPPAFPHPRSPLLPCSLHPLYGTLVSIICVTRWIAYLQPAGRSPAAPLSPPLRRLLPKDGRHCLADCCSYLRADAMCVMMLTRENEREANGAECV